VKKLLEREKLEWRADMVAFTLVQNVFNFSAIGDTNMMTMVNYVTEVVPTFEGYGTFDKVFLCYD
jgi:hypothetical protein